MKNIILVFSLITLFLSCANKTQAPVESSVTEKFRVAGNCNMCKNRIEKAYRVEGVSSATWDKETDMLTVTYDSKKFDKHSLQQVAAGVGHDTEDVKALDDVYKNLPDCCQYDRL